MPARYRRNRADCSSRDRIGAATPARPLANAKPAKEDAGGCRSNRCGAPAARGRAGRQAREPPRVIVCGPGVFAKDSSHLKLAQMVEAQNITYGEVDGPEGSKIMASVLYPKDPKRRLEVLWLNDASRSDLSVISINGQSTWTAPKGLKLGVPLAALEKLNGKPFKLAGFDWDGGGAVRDWMGGRACHLARRLRRRNEARPRPQNIGRHPQPCIGDKDFMSSDPLVRAAKPAIEEITIGYPQ